MATKQFLITGLIFDHHIIAILMEYWYSCFTKFCKFTYGH